MLIVRRIDLDLKELDSAVDEGLIGKMVRVEGTLITSTQIQAQSIEIFSDEDFGTDPPIISFLFIHFLDLQLWDRVACHFKFLSLWETADLPSGEPSAPSKTLIETKQASPIIEEETLSTSSTTRGEQKDTPNQESDADADTSPKDQMNIEQSEGSDEPKPTHEIREEQRQEPEHMINLEEEDEGEILIQIQTQGGSFLDSSLCKPLPPLDYEDEF